MDGDNDDHNQLDLPGFRPDTVIITNVAWYYMMLVGHFLLESFKEDVSAAVLSIGY